MTEYTPSEKELVYRMQRELSELKREVRTLTSRVIELEKELPAALELKELRAALDILDEVHGDA